MMTVSLCQVTKNNKERLLLKRLADIEKEELIKFTSTEEWGRFEKRSSFYHENGPSTEGYIGVWEWTATENWNNPDKDKIEAHHINNIYATEIFEVPDTVTIDDVRKKLVDGIPLHYVSNRTLFCIKSSGPKFEGVLCSSKDLYSDAGTTFINDNVISLPVYVINKSDTVILSDKKFYRYIDLGAESRTIFLKDRLEIIRIIVKNRTTWRAAKELGVIKANWKTFREFLCKTPIKSIYEEIAEKCQCTESEAETYLNQFLENFESYINLDDYDAEILLAMIDSTPELMKKCEEVWRSKYESELSDVVRNLRVKREELERIRMEISSTENQLQELKINMTKQEELANDISRKVKERISQARENAADFIAEMAFTLPAVNGANIKEGKILETSYVNSSLHEIISSLDIELRAAGIPNKITKIFACFLYSAYVNDIPILLAGPNGESIADAFSAALFGRTAGIIECSGKYSQTINNDIAASHNEIFMLKNALCDEWISHIPELTSTPGKYFFIVHPFAEDLLIEPQSLFSYVVPCFTELVVDSVPQRNFAGARNSEKLAKYEHATPKSMHENLLCSIGLNNYTRSRLKALLADFRSIAMFKDKETDYDYLFVLFPYMYIKSLTDKLDEFRVVDNNLRRKLAIFMGTYDE